MAIPNICVGICKMHPIMKLCVGCYRSPLELRKWYTATDEEKQEIVDSCLTKKEIYGELKC